MQMAEDRGEVDLARARLQPPWIVGDLDDRGGVPAGAETGQQIAILATRPQQTTQKQQTAAGSAELVSQRDGIVTVP